MDAARDDRSLEIADSQRTMTSREESQECDRLDYASLCTTQAPDRRAANTSRDADAPPVPDDWPPSKRSRERHRLTKLHDDAATRCTALECNSVSPLLIQAKEIRKYFACEDSEPLDAIFSTLCDFLRALCESRDTQRRARRALQRERERKAAHKARRKSTEKYLTNTHEPRPPPGPPALGLNPTPPLAPPDDLNNVDYILSRARRQRAAVNAEDEDDRNRDSAWIDD